MSTRAEAAPTGLDTVKLVVSGIMLVLGIWAFYFFEPYSIFLRVVGLLAVAGAAAALALTSDQGKKLWRFATDSRMEVRKVVWPTRAETLQTTLVVAVMVLILGIMLWLFDTILMAILRFLTGTGA
jgi:preprotein translocase subunit SecE